MSPADHEVNVSRLTCITFSKTLYHVKISLHLENDIMSSSLCDMTSYLPSLWLLYRRRRGEPVNYYYLHHVLLFTQNLFFLLVFILSDSSLQLDFMERRTHARHTTWSPNTLITLINLMLPGSPIIILDMNDETQRSVNMNDDIPCHLFKSLWNQGLTERGSNIEHLEDSSAQMASEAQSFRNVSHRLLIKYENKKWYELWIRRMILTSDNNPKKYEPSSLWSIVNHHPNLSRNRFSTTSSTRTSSWSSSYPPPFLWRHLQNDRHSNVCKMLSWYIF